MKKCVYMFVCLQALYQEQSFLLWMHFHHWCRRSSAAATPVKLKKKKNPPQYCYTAHSSLCVCARVCAPCATVHQRGWCACWIWMIIEALTLRDALLLWLFFSLRNSLLWQGCTPLPLCLSHVHPCPMSYSPQMLLCIDRELVKWEHAVHTKAPAVRPVYTLSHTHTVA